MHSQEEDMEERGREGQITWRAGNPSGDIEEEDQVCQIKEVKQV